MAPIPDGDRVDAPLVLLADDDEDFRVTVAEALEAEGYDVVAVPHGAAAIAELENATKGRAPMPDLVVLDLLMPKMGGIEVLQRLRSSARWASLPVLVVTGVNDPMLPVRLDVPIAFKPDPQTVLAAVRQQVANQRVKARGRAP